MKGGLQATNAISGALNTAALFSSAKAMNKCNSLPDLLKTFASLMLQASEAQRLVVMLPDNNGVWNIRVVTTAVTNQLTEQPLTDSHDLPIELIQSVAKSQSIWTDRDLHTLAISSAYFDSSPVKSALCLPLTCQSKTVGVSYLEHRTSAGHFYQDRIDVLEFLSTHATVLIKNMHLQRALDHKFEIQDTNEPGFNNEHFSGFTFRVRITSEGPIRVLNISRSCEDVYEIPAESFLSGQYKFKDFVHNDDKERMMQIRRGARDKESNYAECRIVTPSGTVKWVGITRQTTFRLHDGSMIGDGILLDITARKTQELELQNAQAQLNTLTNNMPGMVFRYVVHADGTKSVLYISPQVRELFELEIEDVLTDIDRINSRVHPEDIEFIKIQLKKLRESNEETGPVQLEYRVILPGQGLRWRQSVRRATRTQNGDTIWDGVVIDVTDRNEAQAQLLRVTENVPGMVYQVTYSADSANPEVNFVNSKSREMFGVEPAVVIQEQTPFLQRVHPEDIATLRECVLSSARNLTNFTAQYRAIHPDKGIRWHQTNGHPEKVTESGDVTLTGVTIDITDQKTAEHTLRETKTKLQSIAENIPGMVYHFVVGKDGSRALKYVSNQVYKLYEVTSEEALEDIQTLFARIHPEDRTQVKNAIKHSMSDLSALSLEYRVILPKRGIRWIKTNAQPFRDKDGNFTTYGVAEDVTLHKEAELNLQKANFELARATKLKDEFLANMSHELRTPLTAILASAEGLQHGIFGEITTQQAGCANVISESGQHLLELINEVLDLAKIGSGATDLRLSKVDIKHVCQSSLQLVSAQAKQKSITIDLLMPENLPSLQADERRIRQILVNLLDNAVKFTSSNGQVKLSVEHIHAADKTDQAVRFVVQDTGSGIEESKLDSLFEPFMQVQTTLNREYGGTGLGLALVKQLTELHDGTVSVDSTPGVGSTFYVNLPITRKDHTTKSPALLTGPGKEGAHKPQPIEDQSPLVLMAEDETSVGVTTQRYLEAKNFQVHWVTDGEAAIKAAKETEPDIILMDVQMPRVDGLQAIKEVRKIAAHEHTPIIALTGLAMQDDEKRCLAAGANYYLSKPYRMQKLIDLMQSMMRHEEA